VWSRRSRPNSLVLPPSWPDVDGGSALNLRIRVAALECRRDLVYDYFQFFASAFDLPRCDQRQAPPSLRKRHRLDAPRHHTGVPERERGNQRRYDEHEPSQVPSLKPDWADHFRSPNEMDGPVQVFLGRVDLAFHEQSLEAALDPILGGHSGTLAQARDPLPVDDEGPEASDHCQGDEREHPAAVPGELAGPPLAACFQNVEGGHGDRTKRRDDRKN